MRETCQLLIVVPGPRFVSREDNSGVPACTPMQQCTQMQLKLFVASVYSSTAHLAAQVVVTTYFKTRAA